MRFATTLHFDAPDYATAIKLTAKIIRENPGTVGTGVQAICAPREDVHTPSALTVKTTWEDACKFLLHGLIEVLHSSDGDHGQVRDRFLDRGIDLYRLAQHYDQNLTELPEDVAKFFKWAGLTEEFAPPANSQYRGFTEAYEADEQHG
jgi:hypothetical protein